MKGERMRTRRSWAAAIAVVTAAGTLAGCGFTGVSVPELDGERTEEDTPTAEFEILTKHAADDVTIGYAGTEGDWTIYVARIQPTPGYCILMSENGEPGFSACTFSLPLSTKPADEDFTVVFGGGRYGALPDGAERVSDSVFITR